MMSQSSKCTMETPPSAVAATTASALGSPTLRVDCAVECEVVSNGKVALITGITGQDGSYLAELLLKKGYTVHGIVRRLSAKKLRPHEIYNLGAQSHVAVSYEMSEHTADTDALGTLRLLNAIRSAGLEATCRLFQASTSELFGKTLEVPQKETTPFYPRSPYAVAKQFAFWSVKNYREAYGMFAANGILFNHESPRRGDTFVTRKITCAVARIKRGLQEALLLGNLDATRDWGHAADYARGMWLILQHDTPDDFVLATGESRTVREFCEHAFAAAGIALRWEGAGAAERGLDAADPARVLVTVDPAFFRPTEGSEEPRRVGDASKARAVLGWERRVSFAQLVAEMVAADLARLDRGGADSSPL